MGRRWWIAIASSFAGCPVLSQYAEQTACLRWQGHGCPSIQDRELCLSSKDGRPAEKHPNGAFIRGQACVWCEGVLCTNPGNLCEPMDFMRVQLGLSTVEQLLAPGQYEMAACQNNVPVVTPPSPPLQQAFYQEDDWQPMDGGTNRGCRGNNPQDNGIGFPVGPIGTFRSYDTWTVDNLEQCKALCKPGCYGIEFHAEGNRCEVWHKPVYHSAQEEGSLCLVLDQQAKIDFLQSMRTQVESCLIESKCSELKDGRLCLSSKDSVHQQPCIWCGGQTCLSRSTATCESFFTLLHSQKQELDLFRAMGKVHVAGCQGDYAVIPASVAAVSPAGPSWTSLARPTEDGMACLQPQASGCSGIHDKLMCLSSKDASSTTTIAGLQVAGEPCVWCGGRPCTSNGPAVCEPYDWVARGYGRVYATFYAPDVVKVAQCRTAASVQVNTQCLKVFPSGCNKIRDESLCLSSVDGRPYSHVAGLKASGEPCVWCGGQPCHSNNDNLCEPLDFALHGEGHAFDKFNAAGAFKVAACLDDQSVNPGGVSLAPTSMKTEIGMPSEVRCYNEKLQWSFVSTACPTDCQVTVPDIKAHFKSCNAYCAAQGGAVCASALLGSGTGSCTGQSVGCAYSFGAGQEAICTCTPAKVPPPSSDSSEFVYLPFRASALAPGSSPPEATYGNGVIPAFSQCGGAGFKGPSQCQDGYSCQADGSQLFFRCRPDFQKVTTDDQSGAAAGGAVSTATALQADSTPTGFTQQESGAAMGGAAGAQAGSSDALGGGEAGGAGGTSAALGGAEGAGTGSQSGGTGAGGAGAEGAGAETQVGGAGAEGVGAGAQGGGAGAEGGAQGGLAEAGGAGSTQGSSAAQSGVEGAGTGAQGGRAGAEGTGAQGGGAGAEGVGSGAQGGGAGAEGVGAGAQGGAAGAWAGATSETAVTAADAQVRGAERGGQKELQVVHSQPEDTQAAGSAAAPAVEEAQTPEGKSQQAHLLPWWAWCLLAGFMVIFIMVPLLLWYQPGWKLEGFRNARGGKLVDDEEMLEFDSDGSEVPFMPQPPLAPPRGGEAAMPHQQPHQTYMSPNQWRAQAPQSPRSAVRYVSTPTVPYRMVTPEPPTPLLPMRLAPAPHSPVLTVRTAPTPPSPIVTARTAPTPPSPANAVRNELTRQKSQRGFFAPPGPGYAPRSAPPRPLQGPLVPEPVAVLPGRPLPNAVQSPGSSPTAIEEPVAQAWSALRQAREPMVASREEPLVQEPSARPWNDLRGQE